MSQILLFSLISSLSKFICCLSKIFTVGSGTIACMTVLYKYEWLQNSFYITLQSYYLNILIKVVIPKMNHASQLSYYHHHHQLSFILTTKQGLLAGLLEDLKIVILVWSLTWRFISIFIEKWRCEELKFVACWRMRMQNTIFDKQ